MGLFGKLISLPFKVAKTAAEITENVADEVLETDSKGTFSKPLEDLAKDVEKLDE
jgi:hypothetical protein